MIWISAFRRAMSSNGLPSFRLCFFPSAFLRFLDDLLQTNYNVYIRLGLISELLTRFNQWSQTLLLKATVQPAPTQLPGSFKSSWRSWLTGSGLEIKSTGQWSSSSSVGNYWFKWITVFLYLWLQWRHSRWNARVAAGVFWAKMAAGQDAAGLRVEFSICTVSTILIWNRSERDSVSNRK